MATNNIDSRLPDPTTDCNTEVRVNGPLYYKLVTIMVQGVSENVFLQCPRGVEKWFCKYFFQQPSLCRVQK